MFLIWYIKKISSIGTTICFIKCSKQFSLFFVIEYNTKSEFLLKKGFEPELEYLKTENIPVFWGKEPNYKENIIKFIT